MTPFEALVKRNPSVKHFKVFGCEAFALIPKNERRKLDSKAVKCIFLGYAEFSKGYRLFDIEKSKVTISRDVKFNENKIGF